MVTTTSLTPDLKFKVAEMDRSDLPGDKELANTARTAIKDLLKTLLPVLVYVDENIHGARAIRVAKDGEYTLLLRRDGVWTMDHGVTKLIDGSWEEFDFSDVIAGLKVAFEVATEKKALHAKALEERTKLLTNIDALIKGEVPAEQ